MKPRVKLAIAAGVVALLILAFWQTQRQDVARSNDRVVKILPSPDGRMSAFIVTRESLDVSGDVLKIFVGPPGAAWDQGKMLMVGEPLSEGGDLVWLNNRRLCLIASSQDDVRYQVDRVQINQADVGFQIHPDAASCERASWS